MLRRHAGKTPVLGKDVFVAETAAVIGDVVIGDGSSVWYATTIRGDGMPIRIGARTNIQDGSTLHITHGKFGTTIGDDVTVGHNVIVHACTVENFCLIGMGSILLDGCVIGAGSFVGAGALVTPGTVIPPGSFVLGAPAKVRRSITAGEREAIDYGAKHYVEQALAYLAEAGTSSLP